MNKPPKAVIYARFSSEDQQRPSNVDQGSAEGLSAATVASRPALKDLLYYIERNRDRIASLIVDDASRFGRHIDDFIVELAKKR